MKPNGYWQYDSRNREFISPNGRRFDIFQMVEWLNSPDGRPTATSKVELPEGGKMLACCRHDFPLGTCYICK